MKGLDFKEIYKKEYTGQYRKKIKFQARKDFEKAHKTPTIPTKKQLKSSIKKIGYGFGRMHSSFRF